MCKKSGSARSKKKCHGKRLVWLKEKLVRPIKKLVYFLVWLKEKLKPAIGWILVIFIAIFIKLLLCAAFLELKGQEGLWVRHCGPPTPQMISFFNIAAMKDVAKTVGISSILVLWIYNKLDKQEFGIKYSDLLKKQFQGYHVCVMTHILSILICIWAANVGSIECAALSLAIILLNMVLQMYVLLGIILNTNRRKSLAYLVWEEQLNRFPGRETRLSLEENIPCDDSEACKEMCKLFMHSLYCDEPSLEEFSYSWETLMRGKNRKSQMILADNCIAVSWEGNDRSATSKEERCFCIWASYLLWYQRDFGEFHESTDSFSAIYDEIFRMYARDAADKDAKQCLVLCGALLGTAYFMTGQARILNAQLASLASLTSEQNINICKDLGRTFLRDSLPKLLNERINKRINKDTNKCIFDAIWRHSVNVQQAKVQQTIGEAVPV